MAVDQVSVWLTRLGAQTRSIRGRLTILAVALVGVALLVGAVALVTVLKTTLSASVLAEAQLRAGEVATQLRTGDEPHELALSGSDDVLIQVLGPGGVVIAASPDAPEAPLAALRPGGSVTVEVPGDNDPYVVAAADAGASRLVLVGRTLDLVVESTDLVTILLAVGLPILLVLVGVVAWLLVGRALDPVEAMRREAAEISGAELHRRVPAGGGTDEIERLATTLNDMLDRLERSHARQRQLVADTSHELRSPIASIRQHTEVALAHPERTTTTELAETVLAEDLRLARMVDDLLLLARADEGSLHLDRRPVDLDDLVLQSARLLRRDARLEVNTSTVSGGRVRGDADGLRRAIDNLAENAARHAGSRVAFSVAEEGGVVRLWIDDDGPGIPPTDRDRVFERFVRLDAARARDDGGSGLGLAIVAEIVAAHRGTVAIGDSPLGGTRVEVKLPRAEA